jgi:SAM-dependent methyltransferase
MEGWPVQQTSPPVHLLQRIANNPSATDFANSFGALRNVVKDYLRDCGYEFSSFQNILDLGCGVGRFMFAFQKELQPHQRLWGCDVYKECAEWCQKYINFAETTHTDIEPPLPYEAGQFDFVYALSVYTHLRLDMQFQWAWEIHRVLRPGGLLFATLHGPFFFPEFFEAYHSHAQRGEVYSFGEDGLFAYLSFFDKSEDEGQVDVAAAHTPGFVKEQFSGFEMVRRFPQSLMAAGQDLYLLRKPEHGRTIVRPLRDKKGPEPWAWKEEKRLFRGRVPVELTCHLNGHQVFRVYPRSEPAGIYKLQGHVEIRAGKRVLAEQRLRLNNNRAYGKSHHAVVEVPIPACQEEVTVKLSSEVTERGTLPANAHPEVAWCFPNFI